MGLNSALVDQARRVVMTPTARKVEGTTVFEELTYPWFRCRMTFGYAWSRRTARESVDPEGGHERISHNATLLCGIKDTEGNPLTIAPSERVEVNSKQLGQGIYEITGEPEPVRKKRKVIGYTLTIVKVDEGEFTRARA